MKTSTPSFGNLSRKRRSLIHEENSFITLEQNAGAIESELQDRRQEAINKSTEVRKSVAVPLLDLEHYKDCIKLSTENKINSKNAFSLLLIDLMAAMTKKKDSEINKNFQVASCTLDASVKIYGYRVDAVHTDVMKMVGGLGSKQLNKEDEGVDDISEKENEDGETKKVVKKKRKKSTLAKPESLNIKSDADALLDGAPRENLFSQKSDFHAVLLNIPRFSDECCYTLDADFPCWPFDENVSLVPPVDVESGPAPELVRHFQTIQLSDDDRLCTTYSDIVFGRDEEENSDTELELSQNNFEFDMNASVQDAPGSEFDDFAVEERTKLNVPVGGYDSGDEIVVSQPCRAKTNRVNITEMKNRISMQALEYSLFDDNVFKSWAGPTHWKVRPIINKNNSEDKENKEVRQVGTKRTRKGRTLPSVELMDFSESEMEKMLATGERTILAPTTMHNWDANNTTIPKDCQYKSRSIFSLFQVPILTIAPRAKEEIIDESYETEDENIGDKSDLEELEYCSGIGTQLVDEVDTDLQTQTQPTEQQWAADNMVAVPNKVGKIVLSSFKRVKHIDIKNLKKHIWNILISPNSPVKEKKEKITQIVSFRSLIEVYPQRLPSSLVSNLSATQVFNALLHLTNEKSLTLKQDKDKRKIDFEISQ